MAQTGEGIACVRAKPSRGAHLGALLRVSGKAKRLRRRRRHHSRLVDPVRPGLGGEGRDELRETALQVVEAGEVLGERNLNGTSRRRRRCRQCDGRRRWCWRSRLRWQRRRRWSWTRCSVARQVQLEGVVLDEPWRRLHLRFGRGRAPQGIDRPDEEPHGDAAEVERCAVPERSRRGRLTAHAEHVAALVHDAMPVPHGLDPDRGNASRLESDGGTGGAPDAKRQPADLDGALEGVGGLVDEEDELIGGVGHGSLPEAPFKIRADPARRLNRRLPAALAAVREDEDKSSFPTRKKGYPEMRQRIRRIPIALKCLLVLLAARPGLAEDSQWVVHEGKDGPGKGKKIVLVSGDEEYRSEEALPQLGKILAERHGFHCTVLFAIDPRDGTINPKVNDNIPGLEALASADLLVLFTRFRNLPDDQMKHLVDYIESGRPIVALRTSTHAFNIPKGRKYAKYSFDSKEFDGGFGRQVLGETWISHHGRHGSQSCRGVVAKGMEGHPILRGVTDVWGPTDVYGVRLPLPGDSRPLLLGQVIEGMKPTDKPASGKQNDPMMPLAWIKTYTGAQGKAARVFTTTMGASTDLQNEGLRRLLVNACYWGLGLEDKIPEKSNVDLIGSYEPLPFKFDGFKKGVKPSDHK